MKWNETFRHGIQKALANVEAMKAVGWTSVYLGRDDEKPWELVTSMDSGGLHRLAVSVSVNFKVQHPCGLEFNWSEDMEPRSANGSGYYNFDVAKISSIMAKLTGKAKDQFREYLTNTCIEIQKNADEFQGHATNMYGSIETLRRLAAGAEQLPETKSPAPKSPAKGKR